MAVDDVRRGHVLPLAGQLDAGCDRGVQRQSHVVRPRRPRIGGELGIPHAAVVAHGSGENLHQPTQPHAVPQVHREVANGKVVLADGFLRVVQPVAHVADVPQHVAGAVRGRAQRELRDGGAALARGVPAEE